MFNLLNVGGFRAKKKRAGVGFNQNAFPYWLKSTGGCAEASSFSRPEQVIILGEADYFALDMRWF